MKINRIGMSVVALCTAALLGACGNSASTTGAAPSGAMSSQPAASSAMPQDQMDGSMMQAKAYVTYDEWMKSMDSFTGHKLIAIHIGTDAASMTLDKALMKADAMTRDSMGKPGDTMEKSGDAMMADALPHDTTVIKVTDAKTAATLMIAQPGMAVELDAMGKPMTPFAVATLADLSKGMMR